MFSTNSVFDTTFQAPKKIFWHDKIMAKTILKIFPRRVTPNYVTLFRLVATPAVTLLMYFEHFSIGLVSFLIVAFTDAIDGSMARTRSQITELGKFLDPLADKILIGSMVFVIILRYIDFWTAMVIVIMEIAIIFAVWIRKGKEEANIWGKVKMHLQVYGVVILLLAIIFNWASLLPIASGVLYLAIAFAVMSLLTHGV